MMDPNANLAEQRAIIARWYKKPCVSKADADRLAELVEALDGWLSSGGALPRTWERK